VGVCAVLIDGAGRKVRSIADPAGGTFDAAGDFDRLLDRVPGAVTWSAIDPYQTTTLSGPEASALLQELPRVTQQANEGAETRGLARLTLLVQLCASNNGMTLRFIGD
jgi:hypothetical protein